MLLPKEELKSMLFDVVDEADMPVQEHCTLAVGTGKDVAEVQGVKVPGKLRKSVEDSKAVRQT